MRKERVMTTAVLGLAAVGIVGVAYQKFHNKIDLQQAVQPINPNFASLPIEQGFDLQRIDKALRQRKPIWQKVQFWKSAEKEKYMVVFRSVLEADADKAELEKHNANAYQESQRSGGLDVYMQGPINANGEDLSFCIWKSGKAAYVASHRKAHNDAVVLAGKMYKIFSLERYIYQSNRTKQGQRIDLISVQSNPALAQLSHVA